MTREEWSSIVETSKEMFKERRGVDCYHVSTPTYDSTNGTTSMLLVGYIGNTKVLETIYYERGIGKGTLYFKEGV